MLIFKIPGDFFLNDLIEAEDKENRCIVADVSYSCLAMYIINTNSSLTPVVSLMHFTLSNARRFYSSIGKVLRRYKN